MAVHSLDQDRFPIQEDLAIDDFHNSEAEFDRDHFNRISTVHQPG